MSHADKWSIEQADEGSAELERLLWGGWEPFAVTERVRGILRDAETVKVIWLKYNEGQSG